MDIMASVQSYFKAWNTADEGERKALLAKAWTDDGVYTDPMADVHGRDALVKHIGQVLSSPQFKGASLAPASGVDIHHKVLRFEWVLNGADGKPLMKGMDYGEVAEDGKLTKIIGFFGPFPEKK